MTNINNVSYPGFTGIEAFLKNNVVSIDKKLFGHPIYWTVKEDGMNVGCYLDENGELQLRTSEQIKISEDMRQRFLNLPYAQNIIDLLKNLTSKYPDEDVVLFGEFMVKGKSPKRIVRYDQDAFKAFDLYLSALDWSKPFMKWPAFKSGMDAYQIPRVDLVILPWLHLLTVLWLRENDYSIFAKKTGGKG